jgi:hypothetical protein
LLFPGGQFDLWKLYLIDRHGRVAYKGGRGPFGFKVRELEQSLIMLLLDQKHAVARSSRTGPGSSVGH